MYSLTRNNHIKRLAAMAAVGLLAATAGSFALAPQAHAATTFAKEITSSTTTNYDITGDGKADTLEITGMKNNGSLTKKHVYVNGKKLLTLEAGYSVAATLIRVKSGSTFLYVKSIIDDDDAIQEGVYTYSKGKLVKSLDTSIWPNCYNFKLEEQYHNMCFYGHNGVRSFKVSGNTVKIKFYNMTSIAGTLCETFSFKKSGTKLKMKSKTTKAVSQYGGNKTLTAYCGFNIYGKSSGKGKVTKVAKGTKVTLKAVQLRPSDHFIAVKVKTSKGKAGWITYKSLKGKSYNALHCGTLFKETYMAG